MRFFPNTKKRLHLFWCLIVLGSNSLFGQLSIDPTATAAEMAAAIAGPGVTVSGVTLNCPTNAYGSFSGGTAAIGLESGILLTSGQTAWVAGPNMYVSSGYNNGTPGDALLTAITGSPTFDACALEFDIMSTCNVLTLHYVFASEEYPEFVGSVYDAFGLFISGPGITGTQNIAVVPGTSTPVTINNVSPITNAIYYVDNTGGALVGYDGYTTGLFATQTVYPCSTYHVKFVVADVVDAIYDTGVFLETGAFSCNMVEVIEDTAVEACGDGIVNIIRLTDVASPDTIVMQILGTATNGVDYAMVDTNLIFLPGDSISAIVIDAFDDGLPEGTEVVQIVLSDFGCGSWGSDTIEMYIQDPFSVDLGPDVSGHPGDVIPIGLPLGPDKIITWTGSGAAIITGSSTVSPTYISSSTPGLYVFVGIVTDTLTGCTSMDTVLGSIIPLPPPPSSVSSYLYSGGPVKVKIKGSLVDPIAIPWNSGSPAMQDTLFIPNVFSPNEDGINDEWKVIYNGDQPFQAEVFDRWGASLFSTQNKMEGWKGRDKSGITLIDGVFFYRVSVGNQIFSGNITVIH